MTVTRLMNGAYQVSAMVIGNTPWERLETQTYYGYTQAQCVAKYKEHLYSNCLVLA